MTWPGELPEGQIPFKVYYRDGSTYVGPPENAPALGVALILAYDQNNGRCVIPPGDYYMWEGKGWLSGDSDTRLAYINEPGWKKYLVGAMMFFEDWNELNKIANQDPDFPPRKGHYRNEK